MKQILAYAAFAAGLVFPAMAEAQSQILVGLSGQARAGHTGTLTGG